MTQQGLVVSGVVPDSIAHEMGIEPGDRVMEINGQPIRDIIDYRFLICDDEVSLELAKAGGEVWIIDIEKDFGEDLGLDYEDSGLSRIRRCQNRCIFCFVDQMPPSMRETLYIKDDDFRLSFIQGNFITLSNLRGEDMERIIAQRLSPIYVSVHTTNPELRGKMVGNKRAAGIMSQLERLTQSGIEVHTQMVLCPGVNDGIELDRSLEDLFSLGPRVQSLALVPVGLTSHRDNLYPLRKFNSREAGEIIETVIRWQRVCKERRHYPWVFASDEFYLTAGIPIPPARNYADFPQTENGVGLVRLFMDRWDELWTKHKPALNKPKSVTIVTGVSGSHILGPVTHQLNTVENLRVELAVIENRFFGPSVTVTGLVTGRDIKDQLSNKKSTDLTIIPSVMLRSGERVFLDGVALEELSGCLKTPVAVAAGPDDILKHIYTE